MYPLIRERRVEEFNRCRTAGEKLDLRGCNFRGLDLRGLNLSKCWLEGASLLAAHVSCVLFPAEFEPAEIEMSVRIGTRLRYRQKKAGE